MTANKQLSRVGPVPHNTHCRLELTKEAHLNKPTSNFIPARIFQSKFAAVDYAEFHKWVFNGKDTDIEHTYMAHLLFGDDPSGMYDDINKPMHPPRVLSSRHTVTSMSLS